MCSSDFFCLKKLYCTDNQPACAHFGVDLLHLFPDKSTFLLFSHKIILPVNAFIR